MIHDFVRVTKNLVVDIATHANCLETHSDGVGGVVTMVCAVYDVQSDQ